MRREKVRVAKTSEDAKARVVRWFMEELGEGDFVIDSFGGKKVKKVGVCKASTQKEGGK